MSISSRLLLLFLLVAVLPLGVFSYLNLQQDEATLREEALGRVAGLADKKAMQVRNYLAERGRDVRLLAQGKLVEQSMQALSRVYAENRPDSAEYKRIARQFAPNFASVIDDESLFHDVFLVTPQGEIVYTYKHEADFATNLFNGPYRDSQLAAVFRESSMTLESSISSFEIYAPSSQAAAFVAAPVMIDGKFYGVVVLQLKIAKLYEVAGDQLGLGVSGETVLSRRIDSQHVMYIAPLAREAELGLLKPRDYAKVPFIMRQALNGTNGRGVDTDYRGVRVVAAWRHLPGLDWGMVVKIDADEVLTPIRQQRVIMLEVLAGLLLFSGALAFYFGRQISVPLQDMALTAEDIARGSLNERVDESASGEVGKFARAFNRMAGNMQELYRTQEARIEERTRELNVSNEELQQEIIEREHIETALRDNQEHLRAALDDLRHQKFALDQHAIVATTDVRGTITYVNDKFCEISGYSAQEMLGQNHRLLNSGTHTRDFFDDMYRTIAAGEVWNGEICNRAKDGHLYWVLTTIVPYLDDHGNPTQYIAIRADITERHLARIELERSQSLLNEAQRLGQLGSWELDLLSGELRWSDEIYRLFELDPAQFTPSYENFLNAIHPDDRDKVNAAYTASLQDRLPYDVVHRLRMADGRIKWVREHCNSYFDAAGQPLRSVGAVQDITVQKLTEDNLRIAAAAFETHEGILITDAQSNIVRVNRAFREITGYSAEEVLGKNPRVLSSGRQSKEFYGEMWQQILSDGTWSGEIWDRRKSGEIYPKWLTISAVKDEQGNTTEYVAIFSDITARKRAEEEIRNLAFYDALTGLPNRRLLLDRFHQAIPVSARNHHCGAILFLDMDRFKTLNDTQGHDIGDLMLIEVARRIQTCVRETDTVARLGGDEFVVLLEEIGANMQDASQKIALIAEKIRAVLAERYVLNDHEFHSSPSIGVCMYRGNVESVDSLLKHADMAMYQAKDAGRNTVRFFDPLMQQAVEARVALEADLRGALKNQELQLYYQIQVDGENRPIGAEALIRWLHPRRGMVPPVQFIPVAEESTLILDIGHWVFEEACRQLAEWGRDDQMCNLSLAVNVSAHQFRMPDFVAQLEELIVLYDIVPARLKLELTESVVLEDVADVVGKMHALKALGVRLSLDDFGTGYSSLAYLKQLPLDQIKIDQSFVRDVITDPNDAVMVKTIIDMAQNFRLNSIAEGVETEAQRTFLKQNGCMAYQGYLFSKPVPVAEFEVLARRLFV